MSSNPYIQKQAAHLRQISVVKPVKRVETEDYEYQGRRNAIAMMRAFIGAYREDAIKVVRELLPEIVK